MHNRSTNTVFSQVKYARHSCRCLTYILMNKIKKISTCMELTFQYEGGTNECVSPQDNIQTRLFVNVTSVNNHTIKNYVLNIWLLNSFSLSFPNFPSGHLGSDCQHGLIQWCQPHSYLVIGCIPQFPCASASHSRVLLQKVIYVILIVC